MQIQAHTERRLLNRTEDNTSLNVEARTADSALVGNGDVADSLLRAIHEILLVYRSRTIVYIIHSERQAPIEAIL